MTSHAQTAQPADTRINRRAPTYAALLALLLATVALVAGGCDTGDDGTQPLTGAPDNPLSDRVDDGSLHPMEVVHVFGSPEAGGSPFVLLQTTEGDTYLPIGIDSTQALSIATALEGAVPPRPMTHDLMSTIIEELGGSVSYVVVSALVEGAFHATVGVTQNDEATEIDARTSDAIALALRTNSPIYADIDVLAEAGVDADTPPSGPQPVPL